MNSSDRHTPARVLGKVLNVNGIKCVSMKAKEVNPGIQAKPGIYMVIGDTKDGRFCYIGLAVKNLGQRPFEHIGRRVKDSVNDRMRTFKTNYAADLANGSACMSVYCIETHNYTGMTEKEQQQYMNDREVFHWEVAKSIFGDAKMLNDGKPAPVSLNTRAEPIRMTSPSRRVIDWESMDQCRRRLQISHERLNDALANKGGDLGDGFHVKKIAAVEHPFNPKKHKPEDYQAPSGNQPKIIRMTSPNGRVIDWESKGECQIRMRISQERLNDALANKDGDLGGGFHAKTVATVEHPFNPKKHKPEDYQPPAARRGIEPTIIRMTSPSGRVIDWAGKRRCAKMMRIAPKRLKAVLAKKGGDLGGGFHIKKVATVEHPFNPKKHKPEDYQPPTRPGGNVATIIRMTSPSGAIIDWVGREHAAKMMRIDGKRLKAVLAKKGRDLGGGFHVKKSLPSSTRLTRKNTSRKIIKAAKKHRLPH